MNDKRVVAIVEGVLRRRNKKDLSGVRTGTVVRTQGFSGSLNNSNSVDGGAASAVYTAPQNINGGKADNG